MSSRLDTIIAITHLNLFKWAKDPPKALAPEPIVFPRPAIIEAMRQRDQPTRKMTPMSDVAAFLKGQGVSVKVKPSP